MINPNFVWLGRERRGLVCSERPGAISFACGRNYRMFVGSAVMTVIAAVIYTQRHFSLPP
jgi:hypothetical protein